MVSPRTLLVPMRKALTACASSTRRLIRDRRGVAAVEFALILPFLLILMIGMAETTTALSYKRKISQVAFSMADLVSQSSSLSSAEMNDIMVAARAIMEPFPADDLTVVIASVSFDSRGKATVDWSVNQAGGTPWSKGSAPPVNFPEETAQAGTSIVIGRASSTYTPLFASMAQSLFPRAASIFMEDTYFLLPRLSNKVTFN